MVSIRSSIAEGQHGRKVNDGCHSRVELALAAVLLLVELLGLLLGVVLGLLAVDKVQALGLDELVDLEAGGGRQHLLGQAVLDGLALLALVLLPEAHALEGGRGAQELVGQLGLVGLAVVDLVTGVLCLSCEGCQPCARGDASGE